MERCVYCRQQKRLRFLLVAAPLFIQSPVGQPRQLVLLVQYPFPHRRKDGPTSALFLHHVKNSHQTVVVRYFHHKLVATAARYFQEAERKLRFVYGQGVSKSLHRRCDSNARRTGWVVRRTVCNANAGRDGKLRLKKGGKYFVDGLAFCAGDGECRHLFFQKL